MVYLALFLSACVMFALEISFGSVRIPFDNIIDILSGVETEENAWKVIILQSRLPRALAALIAGACLSISGLLMQTLFRNPLAGPHILGVSAGSSLGVAITVLGLSLFGFSNIATNNESIIVTASFIGGLAVLFILFFISLRIKDILTVLIVGILLSAISMAIVGILQYLSPDQQVKAFLIWTLGSFDGVDMNELRVMLLLGFTLIASGIFLLKPLNLLLLGEEYARSMGLNLKRNRLIVLMTAGGLTAIVTAFCGPIGFVGVVVPHFSRMIFKTFDHRHLWLSSVLIGMNVMLFADLISHLPGNAQILPVNSITALIGIPFIFWMLLKKKIVNQV
ncbi:MAG TPA: iron ABC transporter [Flavobacteriales bacterium]|nr:iron ABC transporter [Flavobacteriales bacterium]